MSIESVKAALEARWESFVAELEALFHHAKTIESTPAPSAPVEASAAPVKEEAPATPVVEDGSDFTRRMLQAEYDSKPHEVPSAPVVTPALDFSDSTLDFSAVAGQNIPVTGSTSKKFTGCPALVWVQTVNGSGSTVTANGETKSEPNGQTLNRLTAASVNGVVDVEVTCNTTTDLTVLAAPQ